MRDFFRWFIRFILIITMMAGCCESCYYFGDMTKDNKYSSPRRTYDYNYDYNY